MCGICGFIDAVAGAGGQELEGLVASMADTLAHRGPDGHGAWTDAGAGVALGHRRLSIIDLSEAGSQPMASSCGRYRLTYNGEIYNAPELRTELESQGRSFRGHSDTEVLLEACAQWGIEDAAKRFIGMFAFAIWDREARKLWLVRDRLGIKPLYWANIGGLFLFASELKALRAHPGWTRRINRSAVAAFMRHGYIPTPHTIYDGVHKLEPGTCLCFDHGQVESAPFWSLPVVIGEARETPLDLAPEDAVNELERLLSDAVGRRMVADVPLGSFLSGGIDSTTVTALMQANSGSPIRTFSIGFEEKDYDESGHAAAVAKHLGTEHTELRVSASQARDVIPRLPEIYDEPFADSSQIPTTLLSELTREHVTVALSGDGGDEVFAGYPRYLLARPFAKFNRLVPSPIRRAFSSGLTAASPSQWDRMFSALPQGARPRKAGSRLHKLAKMLTADQAQAYRLLVSHWDEPKTLVPCAQEAMGAAWTAGLSGRCTDDVQLTQAIDLLTYLPDDILTKVDRASMAASLEVRVPILDHRVVEWAMRLPLPLRLSNGAGKWLLRQLAHRHVPAELLDRPKMGFGVPIGSWLRGPLREWAEDLLSEKSIAQGGLLNPVPIREMWNAHLTGEADWHGQLWNVLQLQAWRNANGF